MQLPGVKEFICLQIFSLVPERILYFLPNYFTEDKIKALQREMIYEKGSPHPPSVIVSQYSSCTNSLRGVQNIV